MKIEGKKVGFVGGGRMGEGIFSGILRSGIVSPEDMYVSDINDARLAELRDKYGIHVINSATEAGIGELVSSVDVVFIAVLPQISAVILPQVNKYLDAKKHTVFSIMGGMSTDYVEQYIPETPVVRVMPNTPMSVCEGCAALCLGKNAGAEEKELAEQIFNSIGLGIFMDQKLIEAYTGIGGCGPAFAGQFICALADGGVEYGLPRDVAIKVAAQVLIGTGRMVLESGIHPEVLKDNVCSPGGGTIAGCVALEKNNFRGATITAVEEAIMRMTGVATKSGNK